jgi:hypothetical protein
MEYSPIFCKLATPEIKVLKPLTGTVQGEDRYSQNVLLNFGSKGYYFSEPGEYLIRAVYQGLGDVLIPSNLHRIQIGRPFSLDEEKIAQDFFNYNTGMALYLNGSSSPYLKKGMETLETVAEKFQKTPVGANISLVLANDLSKPFHRIEKDKLVQVRSANPEEAFSRVNRALDQQKKDDSTFTNLGHHHAVRTAVDLLITMDKKDLAKTELDLLVKTLEKKGVNKPVLDDIKSFAKKL